MNKIVLFLVSFLLLFLIPSSATQAEEQIKTPVLLLCQHQEGTSSWSLSVLANKSAPEKAEALILEELTGKNSVTDKYAGVLAAHNDLKSARTTIAELKAAEFGHQAISADDNIFTLNVVPTEGGLRLDVKARVSPNGFFALGALPDSHGTVFVQYHTGRWKTWAKTLSCKDGRTLSDTCLTAVVFRSSSTIVTQILAVDEAKTPATLLDR